MVLTYYATPDAEPLVLDNLRGAVVKASLRRDLTPIFSFNHDAVWDLQGGRNQSTGPNRMQRWSDLLARMQQQGFQTR